LSETGNFQAAAKAYQDAISEAERLFPSTPDYAESLNNLASLYHRAGRYTEAEPLYREALGLASGNDKLAGVVANNLAALLGAEGRYREAEPLYRDAQAALGDGFSLCNLADLDRNEGRLAEAEVNARKALKILEPTSQSENPHYADCLEILARIDRSRGRVEEAEELLTRVLAVREKTQGSIRSLRLD